MNNPLPPSTTATSKLHPMLWVAALSVTLFSVVGVAALTGHLPGSNASAPAENSPPVAQTPAPAVAPAPVAAPTPAAQPKLAQAAPVKQPSSTVYRSRPSESRDDIEVYRSAPREERIYTSQNDNNNDRGYDRSQERATTCRNCGIVEAVDTMTEKGEGTGLGAVAGGVVGGIIGNQIGGGRGRDVARIAGIAGGAYAGHQIEKSQRGHTRYDVKVRLEDGSLRTFSQESQPVWQAGDRVRIEDGMLMRR